MSQSVHVCCWDGGGTRTYQVPRYYLVSPIPVATYYCILEVIIPFKDSVSCTMIDVVQLHVLRVFIKTLFYRKHGTLRGTACSFF